MGVQHLFRRWVAFNAVGAAGIGLQLGALALLLHVAHLHYLAATALAVEAAVLHNFYWHQRWTWRDRPAASWRESAQRLGRFHLLNGAISLAGNLAIVTLLAGLLDVDPIVASTAAIAVCSLLNFSASEALVFRAGVPVIAGLMLMSAPAAAWAGQGAPALRAWDAYAREIESRYLAAPVSGGAFFAQDLPGRPAWREAAARGEVTTARIDPPAAADGRIHHWAGAIFVPGTSVAQVLERLIAQAGQEARFYEDVVESRLLSRDGDRLRVFMKLRRTTVLTATFNTEHAVDYRRLGPHRASSRSVATRIAELADAGTPGEHERRPGDDRGFLWKLHAYWRFEAADGGVFVECESLSLSRGVPALLRPVANPIIDRVARESLEKTLLGLRGFLRGGATAVRASERS
jgi:putative flippase GtrA